MNNALIGYGIFLLFSLYLCFKLDEKHQVLKFFLISICIFTLPTLVLMADDCAFLETGYYNYNKFGNNFTYANGSATYHWDYEASGIPPNADKGVFLFHTNESKYYDYVCSSDKGKLLVKPIYYIQVFYILYVFLYILWILLTKYTDVDKIMNNKLKRKKW